MQLPVSIQQLLDSGLSKPHADTLLAQLQAEALTCHSKEEAWQRLSHSPWLAQCPFNTHLLLFSSCFPHWQTQPDKAPAWSPSPEQVASSNLYQFMAKLNIQDLPSFHHYTVSHFQDFWQRVVSQLNVVFDRQPEKIVDLTKGPESPSWFPGAKLNIANTCFNAADGATALLYEDENRAIAALSYGELKQLSDQVAHGLIKQGFEPGDAIGVALPMGPLAVAIYLGIIKMGGVVVSIADSFSAEEMAMRLGITRAKGMFTQDHVHWGGKAIPLYEKVRQVRNLRPTAFSLETLKIIVVPAIVDFKKPLDHSPIAAPLQNEDCAWADFLGKTAPFHPFSSHPMTACNVLFSSGTTGAPKAIVWNHTTAIKSASDAFFHHNVQPGDVLAWPTNLGWMMGPWLIFAALMNRACIALYTGSPKERAFGDFIQRAKVTILGVVPTLVAGWRQSKCMETADWSAINLFTSTGECSNPEDMLYLMSLAGYKPIIEYCGGTEIGGAYITSTIIEKNYPSLFTTPAMGLDFRLLDEKGKFASTGEVAIVPPSIGLSTQLWNADHHQIYYADMPTLPDGRPLRRHGDQLKALAGGLYVMLGRNDDTMNLGGIKISAAEIERVLTGLPDIIEVAAVAVPSMSQGGPGLLIIYAATTVEHNKKHIQQAMQEKINTRLNPLFKIHDVVFVKELPKTASNKILRRSLRGASEK